MRTIIFSLLCCAVTTNHAQDTLRGRIIDSHLRDPLAGVTVFHRLSQRGAVTDGAGYFTLVVNSAKDSIEVHCLGYERLKLPCAHNMNIRMTPQQNNMHEVVVTAGRDEQVRADVPMALEKITPAMLRDAKPVLLTDVINKTPGVMMLNLNNEQHGMAIRQPMGTSPYYLYLEDGIPVRTMGIFNHNALIETNLAAVSSIEIVKGPASSLYGPEAVGGAINFITQAPTLVLHARAGLTADNFGYRRVEAGVSGPLSKRLGFAFSALNAQQTDGWMTYSDYSKRSGTARVDYSVSEKTKLTVSGTVADYFSETPGSVDSIAFYSRAYVSSAPFTYRKITALRSRVTLEHQWNRNHSTQVHAYYRNNEIAQNPAYAIRWNRGSESARGEVNSSRFYSAGTIAQHLVSIPALKTKITNGVSIDYSPVRYQSHQVDLRATLRPGGASVEQYEIIGERPENRIADYRALLYNNAAYMQVVCNPVKRVTVTGGIRYDVLSFDYTNNIDHQSGIKSYGNLSPRLGVTYRFSQQAGWYANYSRGFSPPGVTTIFTTRANATAPFYYDLAPALFDSYESGVWTSLLKNRLQLNATVYQMNGRNELLNVRLPDNSTDYRSAGRTSHRGVEYSALLNVLKGVSLRAGGTYAIHRYETFVLSDRQQDNLKDVSGKEMPSAPRHIVNAEITVRPHVVNGLRLSLEWQLMSRWFQNQVNTVRYDDRSVFGLRGVSVLHLHGAYTFGAFEVFARLTNITDELYAFNAASGNQQGAMSTYTPAPPRTVVAGVFYRFIAKK